MLSRTLIASLVVWCAALASAPLRAAGAAEVAPEQRRAIEAVIRDYLLQHPDALIEALERPRKSSRARPARRRNRPLPRAAARSSMTRKRRSAVTRKAT
jgi:copper resistance ScsC-like protein